MKLGSSDLDNLDIDSKAATDDEDGKPAYYIALSSDNTWYLFTEKWIKSIYRTGFPNISSGNGDLPRDSLMKLLAVENFQWEKVVDSEFGPLLSMGGSLETWSWSLNVPVLSSLPEDDEVCFVLIFILALLSS